MSDYEHNIIRALVGGKLKPSRITDVPEGSRNRIGRKLTEQGIIERRKGTWRLTTRGHRLAESKGIAPRPEQVADVLDELDELEPIVRNLESADVAGYSYTVEGTNLSRWMIAITSLAIVGWASYQLGLRGI